VALLETIVRPQPELLLLGLIARSGDQILRVSGWFDEHRSIR